MCHIFVEQVMITLVTFYAPWYLLALKRLCEWLLEISDYFNNHLILFFFFFFFLTFLHPYARHKNPSNINPSFLEHEQHASQDITGYCP